MLEIESDKPVKVKKSKARIKPELLYVNHDPAHCMCPGLFKSLPKGERAGMNLNLTYQYNEDTKIEFIGPFALGVDDMRVLQGLVAMASTAAGNREIITDAASGERELELRKNLDLLHDALALDVVAIRAHFRTLANEIGYSSADGGGAYHAIRASIERLWAVSIIVQHKKRREGFRLLSRYSSDEETGEISVAFNPRLSVAILAPRRKQSYFRIDMAETRALTTDPARLLHQRLQWLPNNGRGVEVGLDTLCGYVWPGEADAGTMRKRRWTVRQALSELVSVGWMVQQVDSEKIYIGRPAIAKRAISEDVANVPDAPQKPQSELF